MGYEIPVPRRQRAEICRIFSWSLFFDSMGNHMGRQATSTARPLPTYTVDGHPIRQFLFQAQTQPHSMRFNRLGLFAFHLNRAGSGRGILSRPSMWANEFVRECLCSSGAWRVSALSNSTLDPFIASHILATPGVQEKCRSSVARGQSLADKVPPLMAASLSASSHHVSENPSAYFGCRSGRPKMSHQASH